MSIRQNGSFVPSNSLRNKLRDKICGSHVSMFDKKRIKILLLRTLAWEVWCQVKCSVKIVTKIFINLKVDLFRYGDLLKNILSVQGSSIKYW